MPFRLVAPLSAAALAFGLPVPGLAQTARPAIGDFGFDVAGMDKAVAPGTDFYAYANGGWARSTPIPADKANYGMFTRLDDLNSERVRGLLEAARTDPASKVGAAYAAFLDEAGVEARGLAPLKPWLDRIAAIQSRADYVAVAAEAARDGVPLPFELIVAQDDHDPDAYALKIAQAGLGMPDRDYYLRSDPAMVATRAAYLKHLARLLTLAGEPDGQARAQALLAFETRIAQVSWTRVDSRDAAKTYNPRTRAELRAQAPGFDFDALLAGAGARTDRVALVQASAVTAIAALVGEAPLAVLKDALRVRTLDAYGDELPRAFADERFDFHERVLADTPQQRPRWRRAADFAVEALPDEVGKAYVARYFPPDHKAAAQALVANLIAAMGRRIDQLDWMAPQTKARAHAKLAAFRPKVGYPDRWRDYDGLEIRADDLLGNARRARRFAFDREMAKLGKPFDRDEWRVTPMTVDAFANFTAVEIVIPAAILQPPFFDPAADPAVNYGGIGASIAHEISHQFDDQGSKYDERGRLAAWWTSSDLQRFDQRTAALVRQYDAYQPLPDLKVSGALTLGENIADLAGLAVAHDAWCLSLDGRPAPVIDGFTGEQRFFLGWAQIWRLSYRQADLRQRLLTNPHAPAAQRVWTVRNLDAWYDAYGVRPSQPLYLPPSARVRIW